MLGSRRHVFSTYEVVLSFVVLFGVWVGVYGVLWTLDFAWLPDPPSPLTLLRAPGAVDTLTNLGEVTVGILGVSLTVVTIIVELASNRYTPRITELFVRDPVNATMMSFYVCTSVIVLSTEMSLYGDHHPETMVVVAFVAMITALISLLPYFGYVFDFLLPTRVVSRIEQRSAAAIGQVARRGPRAIDQARVEVLTAIEQLGDIALNSVENKDKGISIAALNALADLAEHHLEHKKRLPDAWFATDALAEGDQDFVAMHPDVVHALVARRTWVEMKILRQFQGTYEDSLVRLRDISHLIAILTRRIAVVAAGVGDAEGLRLSVRFLNTFMRASLNAKDQRSAYNLLNEYRALGEALLALKRDDDVLELADRCKFYGQLAFKMKLPFILETVAWDISAMLEKAHQTQAGAHDRLLTLFLDVDRAADRDETQEASLRGVRKAQIKLATYYLVHQDVARARRIWDDMKSEPPARWRSIRAELLAVTEAEWWEVSDRGANFEYLPDDQRAMLDVFFGWFESPREAVSS